MNSLSWVMYGAEALDNLNSAIAIVIIAGGAGGVALSLFGLFPWSEWSWDTPNEKAAKIASRATCQVIGKRFLIIAAATGIIGIFLPSSKTVYLIAASQAGEVIIKDPEMVGVFQDLKTIIKAKLKEQLPKP